MKLNFNKTIKAKNTKGFALIEVIVAIFFISTGIIASYILITSTISSTAQASNKFTAAYLAQEGIEIVRNIRDTNWLQQQADPLNSWSEGFDTPGLCDCSCDDMDYAGCVVDYKTPTEENPIFDKFDANHNYLNIDSSGLYSYSPGTPTKFRRKVVVYYNDWANPDPNMLIVCVRVQWEEKGQSYYVMVRENLYNWR